MANPLIEDILNATDIVDIVSKYVPLKRTGSNFSGCCPFHNEKTPSFIVSPTKQIFKCFGCGKGGNVFSFLQEIERIDFWDAVKELAKIQNIDLEKYDTSVKKITVDSDEKGKLKRMHTLAQTFFKKQLEESDYAKNYLLQKRHLSKNTIEYFGLGFAPDKHYELIQLLRSKGFTDNDILEASFAKKNANGEIYAFFRNRITFPIFDIMGNVVGFSARVINPEDKPKYLNSSEHKAFEKSKILYGLNFAKNNVREHNKLIVVEGQMDVIGLNRLDIPVGVATSGTALTEEHVKLLKKYTDNIYLMFDNDQAGQQATQRALRLFYQQNIFPKIIHLSNQRKDVDSLANEENGKEIFSECLKNAKDGFITCYHQLKENLDITSPIDKQKLINSMFSLIISVDNLTIQEHYKGLLADQLGFAFEILDAQFKRYKATDGRLQIIQQSRKQEFTKEEKFQLERERLFATLFHQEQISKYLGNSPHTQNFLYFGQLLAKNNPETILAKTIYGTLDDQELQKIEELTMWRDKQLEEISDVEKRYQHILQTLQSYLQRLLQLVLKNPKISIQTKTEILELRKSL